MPPKVAPPAAVVVQKNLKIDIVVNETNYDEANSETIQIRLFSEWLNCCGSTGVFGIGELVWEVAPESTSRLSKYQSSFEATLSNKEATNQFHSRPGIYAVVLKDKVENDFLVSVPIGFVYVDCSSFVMEKGVASVNVNILKNLKISMVVTIEKPLLASSDAILYEPLLLNFKNLNDYPLLDNEMPEEAINSVYVYGELKLASGLTRTVLAFPSVSSAGSSSEPKDENPNSDEISDRNSATIDLKVCLLPGLSDISQFKDQLTSSTYVLEIHREDLAKRAFHVRNVEEYNKLIIAENGGVQRTAPSAVDAAAPVKGGKAAPSAKVAAKPAAGKGGKGAVVESSAGVFGPMLASDSFLLQCISRALTTSRQIRPHGIVRFRLEQLLSSSNDLLTQFARRRNGSQEGDDDIVVAEDMLLEVRLEKPSKPEKWDLPADISLRGAMERAKQEAQSRLDGTLAAGGATMTSLKSTVGGKTKISQPPRHEQFLHSGTNVELCASLHRKLLPNAVSHLSATIKPNFATTTQPSSFGPVSDDALLKKLAVTPFTRMVIQFRYLDDDTLLAISSAINKVNSHTLANIQGTIRSYSYTDEELQQCISGQLDVISGFMIIDDDVRLVVVEGLAAPNCGMESLFVDLPRMKPNDDSLKILCNPEVLFPTRLYATFGPDLRRIRIRDKLRKLVRRPEIYNRKQVEELCFESIDAIMALKRAPDLRSTKELDMYPSAESLNKLELLYGEAISRADMDGTLKNDFVKTFAHNKEQVKKREDALSQSQQLNPSIIRSASELSQQKSAFEFTDCRNEAFEEYLRTRPAHRVDYLKENRTMRQAAWQSMLKKNSLRDQEYTSTLKRVLGDDAFENRNSGTRHGDDDDSLATDDEQQQRGALGAYKEPKIYMYSQQSLNFKTKAFHELRGRIAEDKNATYTYSQDFVSQTVCVVDEETDRKRSAAESKNAWLTPKGFQYPKPKTRNELIGHPNRPSEQRIEELKEPFMDGTDVKASSAETPDPELRHLEKNYTTRFKEITLFGALKPPEFERDFQLKLVGDRNTLPRGKLLPIGAQPDPNAFRSVHLIDEEKARLIAETERREKEEWQAKVKVDHLDFKMSGFKVRDKPLAVDRASDILKSEPKSVALQKLRTLTSHTGKDFGYTTTPLSLMNAEPYVQNAATKALLRMEDSTKFITAPLAAGTGKPPQDFVRYINNDANNAKVLSVLAKKKHPPQDRNSAECTGPRWDSAATHK